MVTRFPILTFHAVDDRPSVISFSPALFQRSMARLYRHGYRTVGLRELAGCLRRGSSFLERSFVITFDDGYRSVYDEAFPILQRLGFSATVFLSVGQNSERADSTRLPSMCERPMLSWREIKEMHRSGFEFGGHTLTHPDLTRLPAELLEAEVVGSKEIIQDALGAAVDTFAYPFGRYDNRCRELVSRHFLCACSDRLGLLHKTSDAYAMERVDSYYLRNLSLFSMIHTRIFPFYIRALAIPRQVRRAVAPYINKQVCL
jgi:peptidoglycan/xylan/chitin deacetylase (PgdA/CDA1 family)